MKWTRSHHLITGIGLILLVNAIALAGVAWNRSEPADSQLQLSARELATNYGYWHKDNSGIALRLEYRWPAATFNDYSDSGLHQLPPAKMAELGFSVPAQLDDASVRSYRRQLDRDGLLVLEFDGPLYQQQLQRAQQKLEQSTLALAAMPDNQDLRKAHKQAREDLQREQTGASRLFIIDAGQDLATLRARYPDRQRYAILHGRISAWGWRENNRWRIGGSAEIPVAASINLPHRWHALFSRLPRRTAQADFPQPGGDRLFNAEVAFGQRLEPWIQGMRAGQP
ncbi:DUF4824 family protein [Pseudomonas sp. N040]|uniref:DUF4824 family protein n=1 Tax=Pseudomonas sp. N040 TaxID=2785325 RepID=UPI0018A3248E|nr:DUF4824 family protein [Pseudomonas sp. N040]MBF7730666.1 DUF4824 family protein [Pseudomonas sp. N040]MBW7014309.1 DUF4824 family protein [Pseudomonas sp. N040]